MRNKRGQSILEYVIVLTAIIAAVIIASKQLGTGVDTSMTKSGALLEKAAGKMATIGN